MQQSAGMFPYPPSAVITNLIWDADIVRLGGERAGDNWPLTWGDDDLLYTSLGDGNGFSAAPINYTLAFATVAGEPPTHRAQDFLSNIDTPVGWGHDGIKASGMLMVAGTLYLFVRNYKVGDDWHHARLARSADHGRTWIWADWHFSETLGCPEFVQFGRNYAGARDAYVYIVSQAGNDAYAFDPEIVMARVPQGQVAERRRYEFYAGLDAQGNPLWSADIARRKAIFYDPRGTQRIGLTYNAAIRRYILVAAHRDGSGSTHTPALGVFDAPEPWGPWTTVYDSDRWSDGWMIHHKFPTKWMSRDGRSMWLAFSGEYKPGGVDYCLLARQAHLTLASTASQRVADT
jgi:hypothetical protein